MLDGFARHYLPFVVTASSYRSRDLVPVDQATCLPKIPRTAMGALSNAGSDTYMTHKGAVC